MERELSSTDPIVKDIEPAARQWIEGVVGRHLAEDERVYVLAYHPGDVEERTKRLTARERLLQLLDEAAANVGRLGVTEEEIAAAVDEARDHVRGQRFPQEA